MTKMMTSTERKRLAVLSFRTAAAAGCLLAALAVPLAATSPALAEADDHGPPQNLGRASSNAIEDQPVYAPPVYAPPAPPVYAPPTYAPPVYVQPGYQPHPGAAAYAPALSERQIARELRRQGYRQISSIGYDRGRYTARARDQSDRPVLVVLSAETGQVLYVRPLR